MIVERECGLSIDFILQMPFDIDHAEIIHHFKFTDNFNSAIFIPLICQGININRIL